MILSRIRSGSRSSTSGGNMLIGRRPMGARQGFTTVTSVQKQTPLPPQQQQQLSVPVAPATLIQPGVFSQMAFTAVVLTQHIQ